MDWNVLLVCEGSPEEEGALQLGKPRAHVPARKIPAYDQPLGESAFQTLVVLVAAAGQMLGPTPVCNPEQGLLTGEMV